MGLRRKAKIARRMLDFGRPYDQDAIEAHGDRQRRRRAEGQKRTDRHNARKAAAWRAAHEA